MQTKEEKAAKIKANNARNNPRNNAINNPINSPINNPKRMYVSGKYVSRKHPMWKSGHYSSFNDAAFSSLVNYNASPEGDVYIITNKAWPEWVKLGKAIDAKDRLKSYQTGDPLRAYELYHSVAKKNRHTAEVEAHKALEALSEDRKNEWFKVDLATAVSCIEATHEAV
jgi:hypothetical protein|tara:strand:+ start:1434 stop:1940 length:507 start_codon:yes stop_codon:yes gene_type:complete